MPAKKEIIDVVVAEIDLYIINTVRALRVQKELSQMDLSQMIGMSDGFVGKVENPKLRDKYNLRHLNLIARAFNCSPKDLVPDKPFPTDQVRLKLKPVKQRFTSKEKPNYEILRKTPLKE